MDFWTEFWEEGHRGMFVRRTLLAMLVLMATAGIGRAHAFDSSLDLVTGNDFAPFTGENLPQGGLLTEVVQRAFKAVGLSYEVRFMPWKRGYDGVVAGKFLGTFPYVRTPEREAEVLYSDPMLEVRQIVYLYERSPMEFRSPQDFKGRSVCAPVGYALPMELTALVATGELTRESPADLPACVRMVASGRVDAFIIDEFTGQAAVAKAAVQNDIRAAVQPYARVGQHLVVSRTNPEAAAVLAAFNTGLKKLKDSGTLQAIVTRHLSAASAVRP
jgi:ABC-type amino acid transport/signal transduction systems, periplasmic component/domain